MATEYLDIALRFVPFGRIALAIVTEFSMASVRINDILATTLGIAAAPPNRLV